MVKGFLSLLMWMLHLFNPPLRRKLSIRQKIGRTFIITATLVVGCVMVALIGGSILAVAQQILRVTGDSETLARAVAIILISVAGNVLCIITLIEIRRIDQKTLQKPEADS